MTVFYVITSGVISWNQRHVFAGFSRDFEKSDFWALSVLYTLLQPFSSILLSTFYKFSISAGMNHAVTPNDMFLPVCLDVKLSIKKSGF